MKLRIAAALCVLCVQPALADDSLPSGAIQAGTLSNEQLIHDAMQGVAAKVAIQGCDSPENFLPYVMAQPQGEVGSRYWRELWVVNGCGKSFPIEIKFNEQGVGAANWAIE